MLYVVDADSYGTFVHELAEMHRLRCRVFKHRLDWDVAVSGDMEIDDYDALRPVYLLRGDGDRRIDGCIRLLPTSGPNMLRNTFPVLLGSHPPPESSTIWEASRFCVDVDAEAEKGRAGVSLATLELFAGIVELGLSFGLTQLVFVTDLRLERILRNLELWWERLGNPRQIGNTMAVAGFAEISERQLGRVRAAGGFTGPALWHPAQLRAPAA
jgi:acyl homoserine lactone synthase